METPRHPELAELVRHAIGGLDGGEVARHVHECAACAAEVSDLRSSLEALRDVSVRAPGPDAECLDEDAIAALAEGALERAERAPLVAHLASCSRCREAVSEVARALADPALTRELAGRRGWRLGRLVRVAAPVAAAALVVLLAWPDGADTPRPHRSEDGLSGAVPVAIAPVGPTTTVRALRWHSVSGADQYRVTLFAADGSVLFESTVSDTVVGLPATVQLASDRPYYWSVAARIGWDRWELADPVEFTVAPGNPQ